MIIGGALYVGTQFPRGVEHPIRVTFQPSELLVEDAARTEGNVALPNPSHSVLLLVFSADCAPCSQNFDVWVALVEALLERATPPPEIYLVSVSGRAETESFLRSHQLEGVRLRRSAGARVRPFGASAFPSTIVIRRGSREALAWNGILADAAVTRILEELE